MSKGGEAQAARSGRQARAALHARLQARRDVIEQAALARVRSIQDPAEPEDPAYAEALRVAVSVALDYGLATIEGSEEGAPPLPAPLLRSGVSLDTVLRRYFTGYALLTLKLRTSGLNGSGETTFSAPATAYTSSIDSSLLDGSGQELIGLFDHSRDGRADLVAAKDNGDILTYTAQSNATFAAPTTHAGPIISSRLDVGGQQFAAEKPFLRRVPCSASGCSWPQED